MGQRGTYRLRRTAFHNSVRSNTTLKSITIRTEQRLSGVIVLRIGKRKWSQYSPMTSFISKSIKQISLLSNLLLKITNCI